MKKYSLSNIMKRAWIIKNLKKGLSFSECLKESWAKEKELVAYQEERNEMFEIDKAADAYEERTGYSCRYNRWQKYDKDRTYISFWEKRGRKSVEHKAGYWDHQTKQYVAGYIDLLSK